MQTPRGVKIGYFSILRLKALNEGHCSLTENTTPSQILSYKY